MQFHRLLARFTGNERLYNMFDSIILQSSLAFPLFVVNGLEMFLELIGQAGLDPQEANISHRMIYEAIAARDVERAEELLRTHVKVSYRFINWVRMLYENFEKNQF